MEDLFNRKQTDDEKRQWLRDLLKKNAPKVYRDFVVRKRINGEEVEKGLDNSKGVA
jgi:hypothetical protein